MIELAEWLDLVTEEGNLLYIKRFSGNDTLANGSHQAGPYIPNQLFFTLFPESEAETGQNVKKQFPFQTDSHEDQREICATWYNNKFRGKTRNECRLTNFGGKASPFLAPENTGAIAVLAFIGGLDGNLKACRAWVARGLPEEELIESRFGEIDPGQTLYWPFELNREFSGRDRNKGPENCILSEDELPVGWLSNFPSGAEIIEKVIDLRPDKKMPPDKRLLRRRDCEYELFRSLEEAVELPKILSGFRTIDEFLERAQTILQRRKARAGRSLELHVSRIFTEQGMIENTDFQYGPESEPGKKPDFLFPNQNAYQNLSIPEEKLRMLAVKTSCKDRWRQILNEADRVPEKHLLTLQEGVSERQFREMSNANVKLVVPKGLHSSFSKSIRPEILSLEEFIRETVRAGQSPTA